MNPSTTQAFRRLECKINKLGRTLAELAKPMTDTMERLAKLLPGGTK